MNIKKKRSLVNSFALERSNTSKSWSKSLLKAAYSPTGNQTRTKVRPDSNKMNGWKVQGAMKQEAMYNGLGEYDLNLKRQEKQSLKL